MPVLDSIRKEDNGQMEERKKIEAIRKKGIGHWNGLLGGEEYSRVSRGFLEIEALERCGGRGIADLATWENDENAGQEETWGKMKKWAG